MANTEKAEVMGSAEDLGALLIHMPLSVLDMLALVSALIMTIAFAPLVSFSKDDIVAAAGTYGNSTHKYKHMEFVFGRDAEEFAYNMAMINAYSCCMCCITLVCAVIARSGATMVVHVPEHLHGSLRMALLPIMVIGFATFVVALLLFVFGLYFIGWIVFPEPVASSFGWAMSGGSLILFFMALFAYVSVFACCICIRTRMSRSNDIEGETAIQLANRTAAPTPAPALRDVGHPSKVLLTNGKSSSEI